MDEQYHTDLNEWRHQADENLRAEKSWLALTGLYWLEQGENVFGSHPENAVPFPGGAGEENVGVFRLMDGTVSVEVNEDMQVKVNGESVRAMEIKPDVSGEPDDIDCGRIAMRVVKRGDRFGIRMWDQENPKRLEFTGRRWFKARDEYLIEAKFHDY
ncbi:MAG: hypothetical protein OEV06_07105, partial [Anaerolineae bacterium]|nr:hypothetical protein [Anaerolineae bacterium]